MAHFLYPLRNPTPQEKDAFALPREQGLTKVHHDRWSIGIGSRLIAKCPFSVGDLLCLQNEEFVVVDKAKSENRYTLRLVRDNKIAMEANAEEVDTHFYVCPGQEYEVNNADVKKLLGKAPQAESDEKPKDKEEKAEKKEKKSKKEESKEMPTGDVKTFTMSDDGRSLIGIEVWEPRAGQEKNGVFTSLQGYNQFALVVDPNGDWMTPDGQQVSCYSINGTGEIRWPVRGHGTGDKEAIEHFGLVKATRS